MSETVYIETSILGYLTARSTKDLILAANIEITKIGGSFVEATSFFTLLRQFSMKLHRETRR
jgi:hypothetical protein